ncbi:MAG: cytochrome c [Bacteroidetes bacterium]|nr:cytochrome c [Bacteroidota bacterium]
MSRQVDYILQAGLALLLSAGIWKCVQHFPVTVFKQEQNFGCGTVSEYPAIEITNQSLANGKTLFMSKCASCHNMYKATTGPALVNFRERGKWSDNKELYAWIHNPSAYMKKDLYTASLKKQFGGQMMTAFPDLKPEEIDAICEYIEAGSK